MNTILSTIFFGLFFFSAYTQENESKVHFSLMTNGGVQIINISGLNPLLKSNGFKPLNNTNAYGGFSFSIETTNLFGNIGISGYQQLSSLNNHFVSLKTLNTFLAGGYKLSLSRNPNRLLFIPNISFNFNQINLRTSVNNYTELDYPSYINNGKEEEIRGIGIGLAVNLLLKYYPFKSWSSFFMGLKGGYNYTMSIEWKTFSGQNIVNTPTIEPLGLDVALLIGIHL